ncbi:50S ribosomal protein L33 [Candidatus Berkelbacteria bacterium CG10_big_fil_rev_8_21_14_0_10_41_12]|uniref:Large ribosomal subunit protein bL33 n=1 Tax=Candidatus Berkelbacteria bacterium CG10_big_fil_rev_8_21_14_0_10_41_12 TaxID=1974513 RepID=A0A2M6WXL8_9BACT|nr:MAG: 50S ribosomal protein L33 [Candidatus Berkelbacteria bacterium CG10_big_fil_rev_8_21_14_0_10_41_12]
MAKKGNRPKDIVLQCSICKSRNYVTTRSSIQPVKKLELKKFCKNCKEKTLHKEGK